MSNTGGNPYEVGYRKPPKHSRFSKGVSGNPGGRPKGSRSFQSIIEELYSKEISELKLTGQTNVKEAIVMKAVQLLMQGKPAVAKEVGFFEAAAEKEDFPTEFHVQLVLEEDDDRARPWRVDTTNGEEHGDERF
jgi:hypothetical protein